MGSKTVWLSILAIAKVVLVVLWYFSKPLPPFPLFPLFSLSSSGLISRWLIVLSATIPESSFEFVDGRSLILSCELLSGTFIISFSLTVQPVETNKSYSCSVNLPYAGSQKFQYFRFSVGQDFTTSPTSECFFFNDVCVLDHDLRTGVLLLSLSLSLRVLKVSVSCLMRIWFVWNVFHEILSLNNV